MVWAEVEMGLFLRGGSSATGRGGKNFPRIAVLSDGSLTGISKPFESRLGVEVMGEKWLCDQEVLDKAEV